MEINTEAAPTFGAFADALITKLAHGFRNEKHVAQWQMTLGPTYCSAIRDMKIADITAVDILKVLEPIWQDKNETASRLRGRIERVLDGAKVEGLRSGENPAQWKGNLQHRLSKRQKLQRGHHAALPYAEVPAFIVALRARPAMAARALEFAILTAARSGEVLSATWAEIDLKAAVWIVPATRMKAGREHRVPLSDAAIAVLREAEPHRRGDDPETAFVFPGLRPMRPLSTMAMEMLLRRQKQVFTVHGFRSSFRDWAAEETSFPREIAEAALAHVVGDATERAYRRGDALEKRRQLMQAWATFCTTEPAEQQGEGADEAEAACA